MSKDPPARTIRAARGLITRARMMMMGHRTLGAEDPKARVYLQDVIDENEARIEELIRQAEWGV